MSADLAISVMPSVLSNGSAISRRWKLAAIYSSIAVIAIALRAVPDDLQEVRNVLHHLNFAPLLFSGMLFGWRGALVSTLFAFVSESLTFRKTLESSAFDAIDLLVELAIFGIASVVAGVFSDRDREQRAQLETAAKEIAAVYQELRQNIESMKKAERLSAAGQLSASLAHEIRNPLESISGAAGLLRRWFETPSETGAARAAECLEIIELESVRLNKLLTSFLEFARPRAPRFQMADLYEIVQSVVTLAGHSSSQQCPVRKNLPPGLPMIECDSEQLKQVLLNLVKNAMQANAGTGSVEVSANVAGDSVTLAVRDEGQSSTSLDPMRMFEPFYTTKEKGTGLGLAISAKIVEQHSGSIAAEKNVDKGMTFRFTIPVVRSVSTQ